MALLNVLDEAETVARLGSWLTARSPGSSQVTVTDMQIPPGTGMSMTTVLFTATWADGREHHLAARIAPSAPGLYMDCDLAREAKVLRALEGSLAVPTVRWLEEDPAVLGSPFIVLDRAFGRVPADDPPYPAAGWVMDLPPTERGKLYPLAIDVLATLHSLDWKALGLDFLDRPESGPRGIDHQIDHWERVYEWAHDGRPNPFFDAAFDWVKANRPHDDDELAITWGDPRIGNMMFGDDLSVQAVLDWEMATVASPGQDLGWFCFLVRFYSEGIGLPVPEGMQSIDELLELYRQRTGRPLAHAHFHEVFGGLRLSILMIRAGTLMIAGGAVPDGDPMPFNNPASQLLARIAGLPAPEGDSSFILGKR